MNLANNKNSNRKILVCFFILILTTNFFDAIIFRDIGRPLVIMSFIILLFFLKKCRRDDYNMKQWVICIWIMIFGSIVYSNIVNGQSLLDVAVSSYFAFGFASFFVFQYFRLSYSDSITLIRVFSVFFCVCYLIQSASYPYVFFSGALVESEFNENYNRMRMSCSVCSYCLLFYGINRLCLKRDLRFLFYVFLGFFPILIMGFRSLNVLTILFTIYLIIAATKKMAHLTTVFVISAIISLTLLNIPLVQDKIEEMMIRQENEQTFGNKDYVRYSSLYYYSNVFDKTTDRIFGGGVPKVPGNLTSEDPYIRKFCMGYQYGLFWNDLGLIGLGFVLGFPTVLVIIILTIRTIIHCQERDILFIRCTLLTIMLGSIMTSQEFYRSGNFVFIGLLMYADYIYHKKKNESRYFNIS